MKILFCISVLFFINSTAHAVPCAPLNVHGLTSLLKEQSPRKILFFSTWCADCKGHLLNLREHSKISQPLIVAAFDKAEKVENTLSKLKLSMPCYIDDGLTRLLKVKTVPTEIEVTSEMLLKLK